MAADEELNENPDTASSPDPLPEGSVKPAASARQRRRVATTNATESLLDFKEGDVDPETGKKIARLIGAYDTCLIYLDEESHLHYRCTAEHPWPDDKMFGKVEVEVDYLRTVAIVHPNDVDMRLAMFLIGEALAFGLVYHDVASAHVALDRAREILGQSQRVRVVLTTLSLIAVGIFLAAAACFYQSALRQAFGSESLEAVLATVVGGVGAALSVLQRTGNLPLPLTARPGTDILECTARYVLGFFAGGTLYLAISADLLLGIVNKIGDGSTSARFPLILGLALAAGASERALPKLVRSFEKTIH